MDYENLFSGDESPLLKTPKYMRGVVDPRVVEETYKRLSTPKIIDGDTLDIGRIGNIDSLESVEGSDKYNKLLSNISASTQKKLGLQGKAELQKYLDKNPDTEFTMVDRDMYGRPILENTKLEESMISTGLYTPTDRYNQKLQSK